MKFFVMIIGAFYMITLACKGYTQNSWVSPKDSLTLSVNPYTNVKIEIKTYCNPDSTAGWGYDIYIENRRYVHQPNIPVINGIQGFKSEADAQKTAELMVKKIQKKILPPTVSVFELDSLGIAK